VVTPARGEGGGCKSGRCLGLKTLPTSCADYLHILQISASWSLRNLTRLVEGWSSLTFLKARVINEPQFLYSCNEGVLDVGNVAGCCYLHEI